MTKMNKYPWDLVCDSMWVIPPIAVVSIHFQSAVSTDPWSRNAGVIWSQVCQSPKLLHFLQILDSKQSFALNKTFTMSQQPILDKEVNNLQITP